MTATFINIDSAGNQPVFPFHPDTFKHAVFSFEQTITTLVTDSAHRANTVFQHQVDGRFLQQVNSFFEVIPKHHDYSGWLTVGLLLLAFVLTLIWYFFPERMLRLLSREGSKHKAKYDDNQFAKPGFVLYSLLGVAFIFTTSLFIYLLACNYFPLLFTDYSFEQLITLIPVIMVFYYLLRFLVIRMTGFLFNMQDLAARQVKASFRADLIQSFLLIPLLLVLLNIPSPFFYYAGLILLLIMVVYKWGILLYIGVKLSKISLYHNILYLCALEIIPVIILLKLLENYGLVIYN